MDSEKDVYLLVTNKKELPTTKQDHTHFTVSDNQVTEVTINQGVLSKMKNTLFHQFRAKCQCELFTKKLQTWIICQHFLRRYPSKSYSDLQSYKTFG